MPRQKLRLICGGGVDRKTGTGVVDASAYASLKNVHLYKGRMEFRTGLGRKLAFGWGTDLIGVTSIRSEGLAACFVFNAPTKEVRLYAVDGLFGPPTLLATVWTLTGTTGLPVILAEDLYEHLVIAHDEPDITKRGNTRVLDVTTLVLSDMMLDLDRSGTPHPVQFRGVAKYGNYLTAWGYGTHDTTPDSPHTLRISEAGDPTNFIPEHYFQVGLPGDPIIGCGRCGAGLAIQKQTSSHLLLGNDPNTWGVDANGPLDENFGQIASRLGVEVNGEYFFWSLEGPRSSTGGPSQDLEMPLDIEGPDPDDPSEAEVEPGRQFAFYDKDKNEVVFVFDYFAYVLHLKDSVRRWSYREYGVPLACAGRMVVGVASSAVITPIPAWEAPVGFPLDANAVAYGDAIDTFVAVGTGVGHPDAQYSTDGGVTWNDCTISAGHAWSSIDWSPSLALFVVLGEFGAVATSPDGKVFTDQVSAVGFNSGNAVRWCPTAVQWVCVGLGGKIQTSPDGVAWTLQVSADANNYWTVEEHGAVIMAAGDNAVQTSSDGGVTWVARTAPVSGAHTMICRASSYFPAHSLWVVIGDDNTSGRAVYSTTPDPVAGVWTTQDAGVGVFLVAGQSMFATPTGAPLLVALFYNCGNYDTSSDGSVLTQRALPAAQEWTGLAFSASRSRWVAVSDDGHVMIG